MLKRLFRSKKFRYLVVGGWNTVFGYITGVWLYTIFEHRWPFPLIGVIANVLSISMSFVTYKTLVFRTQGRWFQEYLRSYLVYGFTAVVGIGAMWLLVRHFDIPIWYAQGLVIGLTVAASYVGHSRLTFRVKKDPEEKNTRGTKKPPPQKNQHRFTVLQRRRQRR